MTDKNTRTGKPVLDYPCGEPPAPGQAREIAPGVLWLRMPLYKTVLEQADALPASVRTFLADWTKTCDGCRYCVQTDKTHTRPLAAVQIDGKNKCPLYPSFSMNWRSLSPELYENILASLDATEALLQA